MEINIMNLFYFSHISSAAYMYSGLKVISHKKEEMFVFCIDMNAREEKAAVIKNMMYEEERECLCDVIYENVYDAKEENEDESSLIARTKCDKLSHSFTLCANRAKISFNIYFTLCVDMMRERE
jgi:hypothetical protein